MGGNVNPEFSFDYFKVGDTEAVNLKKKDHPVDDTLTHHELAELIDLFVEINRESFFKNRKLRKECS